MFRLTKITDKDKEIVLVSNQSTDKYPYISLIIGANGTGKSLLLSDISKVFLNDYNQLSSISLEYNIDDEIITASKNNLLSEKMPKKLIVSSFLVNDKFIFKDNSKDYFYQYLGARETSFSVGTKSFSKKLVSFIIDNSMNTYFMSKIPDVLNFLNMKSSMSITFSLNKKKYFFDTNSKDYIGDLDGIIRYFTDWKNPFNDENRLSKRKTAPFSFRNFVRIQENKKVDDVINIIEKFKKYIEKNNHKENKEKYKITYTIDFKNLKNNMTIEEDFEKIKLLMELDLVTTPIIEITKKSTFSVENASSGELHILYFFISILSSIQENSLILIDEPEISLHPNWQVKFIGFLQEIFKEYSSCHFIIASHSHFLVSDMKEENSSIIAFQYNKISQAIDIETLKINTFALSPENILYSVFNSRTSNNYYMEQDLDKVLQLIDIKGSNIEDVKRIYKSLNSVKLDERDPLNTVLKNIDKYIKDIDEYIKDDNYAKS